MEIKYSKQAKKFLAKQTEKIRYKIITTIRNAPAGDVKKLKGGNGYRLRINDFRVIFDYDGNIINIEKIDNRGQVYK